MVGKTPGRRKEQKNKWKVINPFTAELDKLRISLEYKLYIQSKWSDRQVAWLGIRKKHTTKEHTGKINMTQGQIVMFPRQNITVASALE